MRDWRPVQNALNKSQSMTNYDLREEAEVLAGKLELHQLGDLDGDTLLLISVLSVQSSATDTQFFSFLTQLSL